jgi:hypothetical protein
MIWRGYEDRYMHDSDSVTTPTRYGVLITIMREFGWSWNDLCAAPADLVDELAHRLTAENHWRAERSKRDAAEAKARAALEQSKQRGRGRG